MILKIKASTDGATVECINPADDNNVVGQVTVPVGSEVEVTCVTAHSPGDIQYGEVKETVAEEAPSEESDTETAAETGEPGDGQRETEDDADRQDGTGEGGECPPA
jgi:hypothetical protein